MKNDILATITQGSLRGIEEEGIMTFYRIPYGTNIGRFHEVGAAPTWEGTRDASEPGPVFPQNKSRLSSSIETVEEINRIELFRELHSNIERKSNRTGRCIG